MPSMNFVIKSESLASAHNIQMNHEESKQVAHVADLLIKRLELAQNEFSQREEARQKSNEAAQRLEQYEKRLQSVKEDLEALLQEGGARCSEDFRRRAGQHRERMDLEQQRDEHTRALARLSGPGEKMNSFLGSLNELRPEQT